MLQTNATMTSPLSTVISRVILPHTAMSLSLQGQKAASFFNPMKTPCVVPLQEFLMLIEIM